MLFKGIPILWAEKEIPVGIYCYRIKEIINNGQRILTKVCPFWHHRSDKPDQLNGFCSMLNKGDWEDNASGLLWDQVKECGINYDDLEDDEIYLQNEIIALPVKIKDEIQ